ncbi:MFS general substrate transporter [Exidia glandulosa HHB12029]|uniref:MFS general substrate transporter n=1 Tax=Exidia glandulosa HHB12029 TaxID=1314781 RepID=A0A165FTE4_EXIGL|nr:MFS general substrate transporter [Exidia glandulosa HHB12029]
MSRDRYEPTTYYVNAHIAPSSSSLNSPIYLEKAQPQASAMPEIPDGGWQAWATVAGAWFILFATFGAATAFGVFEDFYVRVYLSDYTSSQISWIGSMQLFLLFSLGLVAGKLFDEGYFHHLEIGGAIIYVASFIVLSFIQPQKYGQVFVAHGLFAGLGLGLTFLTTAAVISHHFARHRAVAVGVAFTGSSVGGIVFPIMLNKMLLNPDYGFALTVRWMAVLMANCLLIGNLLVRTRLPPRKDRPPPVGPQPNIKNFMKEPAFLLAIFAALESKLMCVVFYLQLDSALHGVDPDLCVYLVTILNAGSLPGRIIPTFLADRFGVFNALICSCVLCGTFVLAMFSITGPAATPAVLIAACYGFAYGALVSLIPALAGTLSNNVNEIGIRSGIMFMFAGVGALAGSPIHGQLLGKTFEWSKSIIFAAGMLFAGTAVMSISRRLTVKKKGTSFI